MPNEPHVFEPGYTGFTCDHLYLDDNGDGEVCGEKAVDAIHIPKSNVPLPIPGDGTQDDMIPRPTDHKVGLVKRIKWLPRFKWNLKLDLVVDRLEGDPMYEYEDDAE